MQSQRTDYVTKGRFSRRKVLLASTVMGAGVSVSALSSTMAGASGMARCTAQNHASQIDNLRQTMTSPYIERSLKQAMLRSAQCPGCDKPLGRHAISAFEAA